jgi:single-strand DNA-binding protein
MINKVILIGFAGQACEFKTLEQGATVARFSLATSESYQKGGEWESKTEWHNIVVWRNLADRAQKQIQKGLRIYVEGKIQYRKYTDKDGHERTATDIIASTFRILEKAEGRDAERFPSEPPPQPQGRVGTTQDPQYTEPPTQQPTAQVDDLPF